MKKFLLLAGFTAALFMAQAVFAADPAPDGGIGSNMPKDKAFQLVSCSGVDDPRTKDVKEVECNYAQLIYTATRILRFVLYMLSFIMLAVIIYTGFQYLTAGGDAKKLGDAKKMIMPLAIGIFLIFGAYLIVYQVILGGLLKEKIGDIKKSDIIKTGGN